MKGSDKIEMNLNIAGEIFKLDAPFDEQYNVREAEREVKAYIEKLRKAWPESSDRKLLAMTAYQFAKWYLQLSRFQEDAVQQALAKCRQIDMALNQEEDL